MTIVFLLLAALAFVGFAFHAKRRNGHGMAYSAVMVLLWLGVAAWWAGVLLP